MVSRHSTRLTKKANYFAYGCRFLSTMPKSYYKRTKVKLSFPWKYYRDDYRKSEVSVEMSRRWMHHGAVTQKQLQPQPYSEADHVKLSMLTFSYAVLLLSCNARVSMSTSQLWWKVGIEYISTACSITSWLFSMPVHWQYTLLYHVLKQHKCLFTSFMICFSFLMLLLYTLCCILKGLFPNPCYKAIHLE